MKKLFVMAAIVWALCGYGAGKIVCGSWEKHHVQGIAGDGQVWYWVFTDVIVKTDLQGKVLLRKEIHRQGGRRIHGGAPCFANGKLYVPYCGGSFNRHLNGKPGYNWILEYDDALNLLKSYPVEEVKYGAGCVAFWRGHFFVSGGRPADVPGNTVWEYDENFKFVRAHEVNFSSRKGIQTLVTDGEKWYFGVYQSPAVTFMTDADFKLLGCWKFNGAVGMVPLANGHFLRVLSTKHKNGKKMLRGGALVEITPKFSAVPDLSAESTADKLVKTEKSGKL